MIDPTLPPHLLLLGGFTLRVDGVTIDITPSAQRLLALLAIRRTALTRSQVCANLWPDSPESQAFGRLRSTLWRLPRPGGVRLIVNQQQRLALADWIRVDLHDRARPSGRDSPDADGGAVEDVLPDWPDEWVAIERERFRQRQLHALEARAAESRSAGDFATALQTALSALVIDPLRESAHRCVIRTHLAEGNPTEALRHFQLLRRLLREQCGIAPSPATRDLVADLLRRPLDRVPAPPSNNRQR